MIHRAPRSKIAGEFYYDLGSSPSVHTHTFYDATYNGVTLYMPDGLETLDKGEGVTQYSFDMNNQFHEEGSFESP